MSFAALVFGANLLCGCRDYPRRVGEVVASDSSDVESYETRKPTVDARQTTRSADAADARQAEEELDVQIAVANAACPMQGDQFTTMLSVSKGSDAVTYNYEVDDSLFPMSQIEANIASLKANAKASIASHALGSDFDHFVELCVKTNRGLRYRYKGAESGITCSYTITARELRSLLE